MLNKIKKLMRPLACTPLHPQWLLRKGKNKLINYLKGIGEEKIILDIGCFNKWPKQYTSEKSFYIGLDYYETAKYWYKSIPDIYGDALNMPIKSETIDTVLLLDVLEHISDSPRLIADVYRILKPNGKLIMQVPFLYPLHDEPRDYTRYSVHGFAELAKNNGFIMEECIANGHPLETSALLANIALSKTMLGWIKHKSPAMILLLLLPFFLLFNNLFARTLTFFCSDDHFMPFNYQVIFRKKM